MEIIKFNLSGDYSDLSQETINRAINIIQQGGSIVYPTDTLYGLGVNALDEYAVARLFKIKQRPETKPVPIMVKNIAMARKLVYLDKKQEAFLKKAWPGAITAILKKREIAPMALTAGKDTLGLRIPDHFFTQALMDNLDLPLTCTSANLSGNSGLTFSAEAIKIFNHTYPRPDLFLDAGDLPANQPSAVIDLTGSEPKILRMGPVSSKDLMKMLK